jgi:hypothetical protein
VTCDHDDFDFLAFARALNSSTPSITGPRIRDEDVDIFFLNDIERLLPLSVSSVL